MIALNQTIEEIVGRYGPLAYRLVEEEIARAIARNDLLSAELWNARLLEVNAQQPRYQTD